MFEVQLYIFIKWLDYIGLDKPKASKRRQAIIWTNDGLILCWRIYLLFLAYLVIILYHGIPTSNERH